VADSRLPDDVRELVLSHVPSMAHLDTLLALLQAHPASLSGAQLARQVGGTAETVRAAAGDLAASGLLETAGSGEESGFRFAPAQPAVRAAAEVLAEMYRRFPVQVVRAVYERPAAPAPVQQLADAFRLRGPR
jgi:DNA-binding IclR family transcriptional regulator